jgi:uncharacterized repeat protein (TIGR01451 family)
MIARTRFLPVVVALVAIVATACSDTATSPAARPSGPRASASGATSITQPDIQLSGSASTNSPAAGATYSYTFQAKNSGTATAPGVQFITVLPVELPPASFKSVTNSDGSACTAQFVDAQVYIACNLGDMAVGVQKTVTIVVTAPASGLTYSDWATAYESDVLTNLLADKNLGDNVKAIKVTVGGVINVTTPTGVVSYSNFGPTDSVSTFIGWALVGLQTIPAGFFTDVAERFSPTVSGSLASIRLALQQTGTGGNGSYTVNLYADNAASPDSSVCWADACTGTTMGTLVGTFQGKAAKQVFNVAISTISTVTVANGPKLLAGVNYWLKVVPSSQTRLTWYGNPLGVAGEEFYEDPYTPQLYSMDAAGSQGAFQVRVIP